MITRVDSRQIVVNLIGSVTTEVGLRIRAELDENTYAAGVKVTDQELADVSVERDEFHGEWNYRSRWRVSTRCTTCCSTGVSSCGCAASSTDAVGSATTAPTGAPAHGG